MKKLLSIILVALLTSTQAFAVYFPDVSDEKVKSSANILSELGIMVGGNDGKFFPEDLVKRCEIATVAIRTAGLQTQIVEGVPSVFRDLEDTHWAVPYVNLANQYGYLKGDAKGYRPDDNLNVSEICTILLRLVGKEQEATDNGGYPDGYIKIAREKGIIDETLAATPQKSVTRGEVAILVCNTLGVEL